MRMRIDRDEEKLRRVSTNLKIRQERDQKQLMQIEEQKKKDEELKKKVLLEMSRQKKQKEHEDQDRPDVATEQESGSYYTTEYSPEAIADMKTIRRHPEEFLEINIIKKSRVVDTFAVPIDKRVIHYKKQEYKITEKFIYLLPTKSGYLMPTSFYKEGHGDPVGFLNTNKGITGKALSLLYTEQLYATLLYSEDEKYNLFIVILLIGCLVAFAVGCYFVFFHQGGLFGPPYPVYPYFYGDNVTGVIPG